MEEPCSGIFFESEPCLVEEPCSDICFEPDPSLVDEPSLGSRLDDEPCSGNCFGDEPCSACCDLDFVRNGAPCVPGLGSGSICAIRSDETTIAASVKRMVSIFMASLKPFLLVSFKSVVQQSHLKRSHWESSGFTRGTLLILYSLSARFLVTVVLTI